MKVLILSPHTDDGEMHCGGTIARFIEEGKEVYCAAFSIARKSVPKNLPEDILMTEVKEATAILGVPPNNLRVFDYPVRDFPKYRQEILEEMIKLREEIHPDLVILPSSFDTHQDHEVIRKEGFRAFKGTSIWGYECIYNNLDFKGDIFVLLNKLQLHKKILASACYKSQSERVVMTENLIRALAFVRGRQIKTDCYAESFELIRNIIL